VAAEGNAELPVLAPHNDTEFATIANASVGDVGTAVASARRCFETDWGVMHVEERSAVLRRMSKALESRLEHFAQIESMDCGKPVNESRADIQMCADTLTYYADLAPKYMKTDDVPVPDAEFQSQLLKEPVGVVGCITPWNFPLMQAVLKVAPALAAGCTVVLKPAPWASLTCVMLGEICQEAGLPAGALNILTGGPPGGDCGQALVDHPGLDKLSFTGSGPTGQHLLHSSADLLRPTTLELGGKSSMIVFEDADMDSVVDWAMVGIFMCTGQVCSATSRLIVHNSIFDKIVAALKDKSQQVQIGHPLSEETKMGPMVSKEQHAKVVAAIRSAEAEGCTVITGGVQSPELEKDLTSGYFIQPTILTDLPASSEAWDNEIFGPVLAVRGFDTEEEAVAMANDTSYGLANAVFSGDVTRTQRVAGKLQSGIVWQNCNQALYVNTPFGGKKQSGFGRELGESGLEEYVHVKTLVSADVGTSWGWYGS
jgi:betaine-aldehyde dehydrogenase